MGTPSRVVKLGVLGGDGIGPEVTDAALIVLRHHHGYSNREIATALGMRESTISSRLAAAKRRLQRELQVDDVVTRHS